MSLTLPDYAPLLAALDADAPQAQRHLQLLALLNWLRGDRRNVQACVRRVADLVDGLEHDHALRRRVQRWWAKLLGTVDVTTLLADFGFAQRSSMASELAARMRYKLLPTSPDTQDASELFMLALPYAFDARWLTALAQDETLLERLLTALVPPPESDAASPWQQALLEAITYCAGQILATGFASELRLRMSDEARQARPFHALLRDAETLRVEVLHPLRTSDRLDEAVQRLREHLEACRAAVTTVYAHFSENGISVGLVFRLRQLRERILRVRGLLECLLSPRPAVAATRLMAQLVLLGRDRRSVRALLSANTSLLAAKVAERSAETGEHYITRTPSEYLDMVRMSAGGGAVMGVTTLIKFGLLALPLSAFWGGFAAGVNYALSFVLIQLLHFTIATKQPAMTAPAMAAQLKDLGSDEAVELFVDKVTYLVRSQVAAVLGNVLVVFPAALGLAWLWGLLTGEAALSPEHAQDTLEALHLLGPSVLFAAFTGVLLFASSIIAGWVENWFVLHRLGTALQYHRRTVALLGAGRAQRWAQYLRTNISGFAANISLGLMLGLAPALADFFGLGLEVRHVTLTSGQIGAAAASLGWQVLHSPLFWWAVALIPFNGAINVMVSFYMAFRVALRAHNVGAVDRSRIGRALRQRFVRSMFSFFLPLADRPGRAVPAAAQAADAPAATGKEAV